MGVQVTSGHPSYSGTFVPEVWSGKLVVKFYATTVLTEISNTDYEGEIKNQGDKVKIRQTPDGTILNYKIGQQINYATLSAINVELDIDKAKLFAFMIDDVYQHQTDLRLMEDWAEEHAEKMKISIDTDVLAAVPATAHALNAGNTAGKISGDIQLGVAATPFVLTSFNIIRYLISIGTVFDEQNVPEMNRNVVLPAWACAMIKDSELKDASLSGDQTSIIRNGRIGMIDRLTVYNSNLLNVTAGETDILATHVSGLTFASQMVKVDYLDKLENTFGSAIRGLNVFGFKTIKPEAIVHGVIAKG